jgi:hypothetical protein
MTETTLEDVTRLEARVRHRLGRRGCNLRLVARDNGIVSQGRVRTCHAKQLAQQAVMEASGCRSWPTKLQCPEPLGNQPRESQTQSRGYPDGEV